jgi:hypothetical protein
MFCNNIYYKNIDINLIKLVLSKVLEVNNIYKYMDIKDCSDNYEINLEINIEKINNCIDSENFSILFYNDKRSFSITRNEKFIHKVSIVYIDTNQNIIKLILQNFSLSNLVYFKLENYSISLLQNERNINQWNYNKIPIPQPMEYLPVFDFHDPNKKELSIEHLPRHTHYDRLGSGLTFESAWQIYFGKGYYQYIPKPLFDAFSDCYENVILDNGVRRMTLYENIEDYLKPENIKRIWAFRRQLGIDSIGHELTRDKNRIEPQDLPVIITKKGCKIGTTKVIRFIDKINNLESPSKAVRKEITEYGDDGILPIYQEFQDL